MKNNKRVLGIALVVAVMLALVFTLTVSARQADEAASATSANLDVRIPGQFLTGPNAGAPLDIALSYINNNAAALGLTSADLADMVISDQYMSQHNGVTHIYLQQQLNGIRVHNAILNINIASDGSVINLGNRFVSDLAGSVVANDVVLSADQALNAAARQLGFVGATPQIIETDGGASSRVVFDNAGISYDAIPVELMYQVTDEGVRLAWDMTIDELGTADWWSMRVDAATGRVLSQINYTIHENVDDRGSYVLADTVGEPADSGSGALAEVNGGESYRVFAYPLESPDDGLDTLEANPFDPTSNPFGWHDTNGAAGPEFTITQGNNVHADSDLDANNVPDGNAPDVGAGLTFDFPFNLTLQPSGYLTGSIVNLFYWNNVMHDITYGYGFNEAAGNFQENNYGNGGAGSDYVYADAQDGSGTCNANFGTPPDGSNPRMQQYTCDSPFSQEVTINSPGGIAGAYVANPSNNGGTANGLTADLAYVDDGVAPTDDACEAIAADLSGKIALIRWSGGLCNSSVFVQNAANAGAIAAIIIDNTDIPLTNFGGSAAIPSVAVGASDGQSFVDSIVIDGDTVNATIDDAASGGLDRDTDLDNGIINHEYGHGVSNRLTGGPAQAGCLSNDEQMGEGWSDLMGLFIHAVPGDMATDAREVGEYGLGFSFAGIRNFPYSTDMSINPETYDDIMDTNLPHGLGSIWVTGVWEMYWNLVDIHGFNANIYDDWTTGGNNLAFQLVMDGMKLQPCNPGFVDGRDAILAADMALTAGANQCEIWRGFAKRGVGLSADQGSSFDVLDGTQAFDMPLECMADEEVATGPDNVTLCAGQSYDWTVALGDFPEPVSLSAGIAPDPGGVSFTWADNPVNTTPATTTLTIDSTGGVTADGFYTTTITANGGTGDVNFDMHVTFESVAPTAPNLTSPSDGAVDAGYMPKLTWDSVAGATGYDVDVATDAAFANIIDSGSVGGSATSYAVSVLLDPGTTYYWRVTVNTTCGSAMSDAEFTTYEAMCGDGEYTRYIFSEDFSDGEGDWTHGAAAGPDTWVITNTNASPVSGGNAFYVEDWGEPADQYLVSPAIALPAGDTDYTLQFYNEQNYENPAGSDGCWDGGYLEISTDGGANWAALDSELISDPYDGIGNNGPPTGLNIWCGQIDGNQPWLNSVANLDAFAGETVNFRMRMLSDAAAGAEGWYIDDFNVRSCSVQPTDVSLSGFGAEETSTMSASWLAIVLMVVAGAGLVLRRRMVRE